MGLMGAHKSGNIFEQEVCRSIFFGGLTYRGPYKNLWVALWALWPGQASFRAPRNGPMLL